MTNKEKAIAILSKASIIQVDDVLTDKYEFNGDSEDPILDISIRDNYDNPIDYSFNNDSFENCVISGNVISMVDKDDDEADIYCFNLSETTI